MVDTHRKQRLEYNRIEAYISMVAVVNHHIRSITASVTQRKRRNHVIRDGRTEKKTNKKQQRAESDEAKDTSARFTVLSTSSEDKNAEAGKCAKRKKTLCSPCSLRCQRCDDNNRFTITQKIFKEMPI